MPGEETQLLKSILGLVLTHFIVQYVAISIFAQRKGEFVFFRSEFLGFALYAVLLGLAIPLIMPSAVYMLGSWVVQLIVVSAMANRTKYPAGQSLLISFVTIAVNWFVIGNIGFFLSIAY